MKVYWVSFLIFIATFVAITFPSQAVSEECAFTWNQSPRILRPGSRLACIVSTKRELVTIGPRGGRNLFTYSRALRLNHGRFPAETIRARFRNLRLRCSALNVDSMNVGRFSATNACSEATLALGRSFVDLGEVGTQEHKLNSIVLRRLTGLPKILEVTLAGNSDIELLTPEQTKLNGGVPCSGQTGAFCSIFFKLNAHQSGLKESVIKLRYGNILNSAMEPKTIQVPIRANVVDAALVSTEDFSTVNLVALASEQGVSMFEFLKGEFDALKPSAWSSSDVKVFDHYDPLGTSDWANNWSNSTFDLSGVAWDVPTAGAAITRCHVVYAKHFPRNKDKPIKFHRKDGTKFRSVVVKRTGVDGTDIGVGRLDPCLPADWTVYPIAAIGGLELGSSIQNAPVFLTHHRLASGEKRISVGRIASLNNTWTYIQRNPFLPTFMFTYGVSGDSGNPIFVAVNGRLVLLTTFTFPNSGPSYTTSSNLEALRQAIQRLGN